jgi:hypothetical protein
METATNNQLTIIDKSIDVFKTGSQILRSNQDRTSKALAVGENILKSIQESGGEISSQELDERANNYLANCSKAKSEMNDARSPVTQLMNTIIKMYTAEENKLDASKADTVPFQIQQHRNKYARKVQEEQDRKRKEAEEKAAKSKEEVEIRAQVKNTIAQALLGYLSSKKTSIVSAFNSITLENFEEKAGKLRLMQCSFSPEKIKEIVGQLPKPYGFRHTDDEIRALVTSEHAQYDVKGFYSEYERQISDLKQELIDKLPSKKQELEAIARADKNEKIRLENERLNREAAEKRRLEEEAEAARKKADEEAELAKAAGTAQVLFDQAEEVSVVTPAPEVRNGYDIQVLHAAGWVEIFQFWFQREGCKMIIEDMGKKSLNQMKSFAEGVAKKDDVKIESKYLKYEAAVKSVNRKTVKP